MDSILLDSGICMNIAPCSVCAGVERQPLCLGLWRKDKANSCAARSLLSLLSFAPFCSVLSATLGGGNSLCVCVIQRRRAGETLADLGRARTLETQRFYVRSLPRIAYVCSKTFNVNTLLFIRWLFVCVSGDTYFSLSSTRARPCRQPTLCSCPSDRRPFGTTRLVLSSMFCERWFRGGILSFGGDSFILQSVLARPTSFTVLWGNPVKHTFPFFSILRNFLFRIATARHSDACSLRAV